MSLLEELRAFGDLKVWSVLVTTLGDLALEDGAQISGPQFSALCQRLGIKPEALRVALHRLRKENWISSQRSGRNSLYSLTEKARRDTMDVQGYVYAETLCPPQAIWVLNYDKAIPNDVLKVDRKTGIATRPDPLALSGRLDASSLPAWVRDQLLDDNLKNDFKRLQAILDSHEIPAEFEPIDAIAIRVMTLHNWRRLVLRHDPLAAQLLGDNWAGAHCRRKVVKWLNALPRKLPELAEDQPSA